MTINFSEIDVYLDARTNNKIFIKQFYQFTKNELQELKKLYDKYSWAEISKCFEPGTGKQRINVFYYVDNCHTCNSKIEKQFHKSGLETLLKNDIQNLICDACKEKAEKEREKKNQEEYKRNEAKRLAEKRIKTDLYIKNYLDPEKSWVKGIKTTQKFREIDFYECHANELFEYIRNMPYQDFLSTPYWKAVSEYKKYKADWKCGLCSSNDRLATHHRTYANHGYEHKNLNDLIVLCYNCHEKFHDEVI